jgi:AcrR family transcriptional regulator
MQRRRLVSAITEVLAEDGVERASVGRVCKRARVSRRTFYELFDDFEACFLAAFEQALERIAQKVVPVYAREGSWRGRLRDALTVLLECFDEEPAIARLCLIEAFKTGPRVLECRRRAVDTLTGVIDEGRLESRGNAAVVLPLTAESTVGGAISVIVARLVEGPPPPLVELVGPLMSMIVHPYLGPTAARKELQKPTPPVVTTSNGHARKHADDPFKDLSIRITFRTAVVLATIAAQPDASNRALGQLAGVADQGQMSKLLRRLEGSGLIENHGERHHKGEANAWRLTRSGEALQTVLGGAR